MDEKEKRKIKWMINHNPQEDKKILSDQVSERLKDLRENDFKGWGQENRRFDIGDMRPDPYEHINQWFVPSRRVGKSEAMEREIKKMKEEAKNRIEIPSYSYDLMRTNAARIKMAQDMIKKQINFSNKTIETLSKVFQAQINLWNKERGEKMTGIVEEFIDQEEVKQEQKRAIIKKVLDKLSIYDGPEWKLSDDGSRMFANIPGNIFKSFELKRRSTKIGDEVVIEEYKSPRCSYQHSNLKEAKRSVRQKYLETVNRMFLGEYREKCKDKYFIKYLLHEYNRLIEMVAGDKYEDILLFSVYIDKRNECFVKHSSSNKYSMDVLTGAIDSAMDKNFRLPKKMVICAIREKNLNNTNGHDVCLGISYCSPADKFNLGFGAVLALNRLLRFVAKTELKNMK